MCLSPDMMTSAEIEDSIEFIEGLLTKPLTAQARRIWTGRLDGFKNILKERAEAGTY